MSRQVLLTGAATLVGAEVLKDLLLHPDVDSIRLLMPTDAARRDDAMARLRTYLGELPPLVDVVPADLSLPRFGMALAAWNDLAAAIDTGIHCAQRELRDQDLERARQANLLPVENWIQLLERNPALRLHHLSTAFVSGTRNGLFTEFDIDCGQSFHDAWERSKFLAEVRLRESRVSARVTIYRPSHTLGRAATGEAFVLGGAYPLLATLASTSILPGDAQARIDFVPADYVASAMVALTMSDATGTFHLANGWRASLTVRQAADIAAKGVARAHGARVLPRIVSWPLRLGAPANSRGLASPRVAFANARDLLHQGAVFDTYRADLALAPLGVVNPAPPAWLETAVRTAARTSWTTVAEADVQELGAEASLPAVVAESALLRRNPVFLEKRFHQVGDVRLAYRDIGHGNDCPVVFLHGFAGAHAWDAVVERMAAMRRTLVVETLGLGDSEAPDSADFGLSAQAARVRGLLSALDIPVAHVVGNDTGGVIAQLLAVRWPHCVKSLVLSDCDARGTWPHAGWDSLLLRLPGGPSLLTALLGVPVVARSRLGFGRMVHDQRLLTPERLQRYVDTVAGDRERRTRLTRFVRALAHEDLATANQLLTQLDVPTMVIWGGDNAYWSASRGRALYDTIPGARRLELIPFAGVSCHEERPDLFARWLTEFVDEVGVGRTPPASTRSPVLVPALPD